MKDHAQYADSLALYAMDGLDDPMERAELQEHLGTCGECRRELEALRGDTSLLALSATGPQPPQRARQRLMQAIAAEPRRATQQKSKFVLGRLQSRWLSLAPIAIALLLAVFSLVLIRQNLRLQDRNARLRDQVEKLARDGAQAREVMAMLNDPSLPRMTLVSAHTPPQPQVKTIYKPERGHVLLLASNLSSLPDDKVYQLWLLPADGSAPMPAGTFRPDNKGGGLMLHAFENEGIQAKGFAVTVEPAGGSRNPTMPIVLAPAS